MRHTAKAISAVTSIAALLGSLAFSTTTVAQTEPSAIDEGRAIAFDRKKGNCLACHQIEGGSLPGNIGPPLIAMKDRFPDRDELRSQINDSRKKNPATIMPPFGPHEIISQAEIDKVIEFIYSL